MGTNNGEQIWGGHRIRHYGLLASTTLQSQHSARQRTDRRVSGSDRSAGSTMTPTWTSAPHQTIARYAPVAAGRMIIVESFGRGGAPRGPPSPEATMP